MSRSASWDLRADVEVCGAFRREQTAESVEVEGGGKVGSIQVLLVLTPPPLGDVRVSKFQDQAMGVVLKRPSKLAKDAAYLMF
jgi:hypothetical protein